MQSNVSNTKFLMRTVSTDSYKVHVHLLLWYATCTFTCLPQDTAMQYFDYKKGSLDSYRGEGEGQWMVGVSWSRGGACSRDHGLGLVS